MRYVPFVIELIVALGNGLRVNRHALTAGCGQKHDVLAAGAAGDNAEVIGHGFYPFLRSK
jgi:hypothetical protein